MQIPKKVQASLISRFKIMAGDGHRHQAHAAGRPDLGDGIDGRQYDFRVSTLPSVYGEKIVLRILDKSSISVGLHKLGLLPETLEKFERHDLQDLRDNTGHGPDGQREIDYAVFGPFQAELGREEHSHHRGPGGIRGARA